MIKGLASGSIDVLSNSRTARFPSVEGTGEVMYEADAEQHRRKLHSIAKLVQHDIKSSQMCGEVHVAETSYGQTPITQNKGKSSEQPRLLLSAMQHFFPPSHAHTRHIRSDHSREYTPEPRNRTCFVVKIAATTLRQLVTMHPRDRTKAVTALCITSSRPDRSLTAFSARRLRFTAAFAHSLSSEHLRS